MLRTGVVLFVVLTAVLARGAGLVTPVAWPFSTTHAPPNGEYWDELRTPTIDNQGRIAFRGFTTPVLANGGVNSAYRNSEDKFLARVGEQAPGLADGALFTSLTNLQASPQGPAGFMGFVGNGAERTSGLWAEDADGAVRLVALEGMAAPGAPPGFTLAAFPNLALDHYNARYSWQPAPFTINGRGETAFYGVLNALDGLPTRHSVWSEGGGRGLRLVAYSGMDVPQFHAGAKFWRTDGWLRAVPINDRGMLAFVGEMDAPGVPYNETQGVFIDDPARGLLVAARSGQPAPGLPGVRLSWFETVTLNNAGQLVVAARHSDELGVEVGRGLWAGLPDDLQLVAQTGAAAPGVDGTFVELSGVFDRPVINGQGRVAFTARVAGPGIDEFNDTGIWAQDAAGQLQLVVREGQLAESQFARDDLPGQRLYFNNRGQVAFTVSNGIWATDLAGNIRSIVQYGDLLPFHDAYDGPVEARVRILAAGPSTGNEEGLGTSFNDRGEFAFFAYSQNNGQGVFVSRAVAAPEPAAVVMLFLPAILLAKCMMMSCRRLPRSV